MGDGRESTRKRMLDAGISLWTTEPPSELFAGLSVARVARESGVTRSTFYAYWSSTDEYLLDLVDHLLLPDQGIDPVRSGGGIRSLIEGPAISRRFLDHADTSLRANAADQRMRVRFGLFSKLDDPEIAEMLRRVLDQTQTIRSANLQSVLPVWGRRVRPPLEPHHLHAIMTALLDGLAVRHVLDPERFPVRVFGLAVLSLLLVCTRQVGDERNLEDVLEVVDDWMTASGDIRRRHAAKIDQPLSDAEIDDLVRVARQLAASEGWFGISLTHLASFTNTPEARVQRTFGSKMGLGMAIYLLNISERYDELEPTDDALADLRTVLEINVDELRRSPAHALSMAAIIADGGSYARPDSFAFDPQPRTMAAVRRAQDAGQLDASIDTAQLSTFINRTILLACLPDAPRDFDVIGAILDGVRPRPNG